MCTAIGRRVPVTVVFGEWVETVQWRVVGVDAFGQHYLIPEERSEDAAKVLGAIDAYAECPIDLDRGRLPLAPSWMIRINAEDVAKLLATQSEESA